MRTTIDIDEDVLMAIKELASARGVSAGRVMSDLAKEALASREPVEYRNGVPLFPKRLDGQIVTLELVNRLRDEE